MLLWKPSRLATTIIAKLIAIDQTIIRPPGLKIGSRHNVI